MSEQLSIGQRLRIKPGYDAFAATYKGPPNIAGRVVVMVDGPDENGLILASSEDHEITGCFSVECFEAHTEALEQGAITISAVAHPAVFGSGKVIDQGVKDTALVENKNANDVLDYYGAPSAQECACGWSWSLACRIEALLKDMTPWQLSKIQGRIRAKSIYPEEKNRE